MKKILVIDDEVWLRDMIRMALTQKGYEVTEAENGAAGLEAARAEVPDLILCDVNMDKMDGYLTLSSLRNEPGTTAVPFILMTGMADNAGMRHGMELGADDYLAKPFTINELYAAVEARLKKSQQMRDEAEKRLADLRDNITLMLPHELRTPLNGILAYGEILRSDAESLQPEETAEMGQVIYDSAKRLERLIENFLVYAQTEMMSADSQRAMALRLARTARPADVVEACVREEIVAAGRAADICLEVQNCPVAISEDFLRKITRELVSNAFKFSKPGTPVRVALSSADGAVALAVTDRGRGFTPDQIERIGAYMQFGRKLHEQQGLGLGLIIVKRIAELHNGSLSIQGGESGGTVVTVRLPGAESSPGK